MTVPGSPHRAWVEVDHAAIRSNLEVIRRSAPNAQVIGVVKANAYGHGAVPVANTLAAAGVERIAIATVDEAIELREAGIKLPLVLLWGVGPDEASVVTRHALEPIVDDDRAIELLEAAGARDGVRIAVHLKVDTGLGRQGAAPDDAVALATRIARSRHLRLAGTMSHLAVPGEDDAYTEVQVLRLARVLDAMRSAGVDPGLVHVTATGGLLAGVLTLADAVRPGLALYGLQPQWAADRDAGLVPALTLRARALRIFDLPAGEAVGYGLRFRAKRDTRIATLGIGYGDGWPRIHANNGSALVHGRRAPIVGAISMDGLTVDLGGIDGVTYGDEFVLIGAQDGARITADQVAAERRTINYEVTTALRERLPRLHRGVD
ncbi:MAG TPA: alanine racemase [Candidatus Limnocylindrales bacterium]|nr:alanine racemase [Candidatus Limnocylindrales bacterium]